MSKPLQRGQVIVLFALCMALFLFSVFALVVDLSFEYAWSTRIEAAAQVAAQSGANAINPAYLYGGGNPRSTGDSRCYGNKQILDLCNDVRACQEAGDRSSEIAVGGGGDAVSRTTCRTNSDGSSVHADIVKLVHLPLDFFADTAVVRGSFDAAPVAGACAVAVSGPPPPCPTAKPR
ncbi:MAG TPA: hypothetical protein VE219_01515 [Candidatus Sulfotelmatobacter sp.]|nr:hypothetical protein [Candidatus Sulfotelmatobacter sp.]